MSREAVSQVTLDCLKNSGELVGRSLITGIDPPLACRCAGGPAALPRQVSSSGRSFTDQPLGIILRIACRPAEKFSPGGLVAALEPSTYWESIVGMEDA